MKYIPPCCADCSFFNGKRCLCFFGDDMDYLKEGESAKGKPNAYNFYKAGKTWDCPEQKKKP